MTEEEAWGKRCPLAKDFNGHVWTTVHEHSHTLTYSPFCIASACMAWRWSALPGQRERMLEDANSTAGVRLERWTEVGDGHCGLAGAPR